MRKLNKGIFVIMVEVIALVILVGILLIDTKEGDDQAIQVAVTESGEKKYIKWVEFNVTYAALDKAYKYDVQSHGKEVELHWIELLAYLGAKYGGDFSKYKEKDMVKLADSLTTGKETISSLTEKMKYYSYYYEAYEAVLGGMVGEFEIQVYAPTPTPAPTPTNTPTPALSPTSVPTPNQQEKENQTQIEHFTESEEGNEKLEEKKDDGPNLTWEKRYGLKAFSPIARDYYYNDFDDFGVSRSYGYKRRHLGHDMMGSVGTPIIAVESGYVEALGWNQYGGWRIGIRSFDNKRYYYYAHLRKNFPYNKSLEVGSIVTAGQVIGYLGHTGYSAKENVNNIKTPHLHFGLQLIFDESQKEGYNEIWVDCYALTKFLYRNRSKTVKNLETKEYSRIFDMKDPAVTNYIESKQKNELRDEESLDGTIIEYE